MTLIFHTYLRLFPLALRAFWLILSVLWPSNPFLLQPAFRALRLVSDSLNSFGVLFRWLLVWLSDPQASPQYF